MSDLMTRTLMASSPFDRAYGFEFLDCQETFGRARVRITKSLLDGSGALHAGVLSAFAEGLASGATNWSTTPTGKIGMGMANATSILGAPRGWWLYGTAQRAGADGDFWVWDIEICDEEGRPCALSRVSIAVRPAPD